MANWIIKFCALCLFTSLVELPSAIALENPEQLESLAAITEKLGSKINTDLIFTNQNGQKSSLKKLISNKPLIIAPVYYECPRLCTLTQQGLVDALKSLRLKMGEDFNLASISFDPTETTTQSKAKADIDH